MIELGDWLHQLYPRTKNIFLYRDGDFWMTSAVRAYVDEQERMAEELRLWESGLRQNLAPIVPLIAQYDPEKYLTIGGILTSMWLSVMERYMALFAAGVKMLAIRYTNWRLDAQATAVTMLDYCGCCPDNLTAVTKALTKDSQASIFLSQKTIQQKDKSVDPIYLQELHKHLQQHNISPTADFEVPNTLQTGYAA